MHIFTPAFQTWTVPVSGAYSFSIASAAGGGNGGLAATASGTISLQGGSQVVIVVGQAGLLNGTNGQGGGGATYIFAGTFGTPLMVAGEKLQNCPSGGVKGHACT